MIDGLRFCIALLMVIIPSFSESAFIGTSSSVLLDCSNYRLYDFDLRHDPEFDYTQPVTFQTDTVFSVRKNDSSCNSLRLLADLGSETGEGLFNRFEKSEYNREHQTYGGSQISLFQNRLHLRGGYHHLGSYSDQLESLYRRIAQKHAIYPKYAHTGDYGISEYGFGVWKLNLPQVSLRGVFNNYGNWHLLPVRYDPVYHSGFFYIQEMSLSFPKDEYFLSSQLTSEKRYWNHYNYLDFKTVHLNAHWKHKLSENMTLGSEITTRSDFAPNFLFSLNASYQLNRDVSFLVKAGAWDTKKPDGSFIMQWQLSPYLTMDLSARYNIIPGKKEHFRYLSSCDTAMLIIDAIREKTVSPSFQITRILKLPLHLRTWMTIKKGSSEYIISEYSGITSVHQSQADDLYMGIGGKLHMDLSVHQLTITPWAQGNYFLKGILSEMIPFESGFAINYSLPGTDPVFVNVSVIYRTPYTWQALKNGEHISIKTNSLLFCKLSIVVPFISPIFSEHIKPEIRCQAGPIHLIGNKRQKVHPFGNVIGPVISATIEAGFL